jgi:PAS domain S-box-containing protein
MGEIQTVILDNLLEGVCAIDGNDLVVFTNLAFDRMFGYAPGELHGRPSGILRDDLDGNQKSVENAIQNVLKHGGTWTGEFKSRKKDGSGFITSVRIVGGRAPGKDFRIYFQTDATVFKQAEAARLHLLQKLDNVQELERHRLSREIHDQMGQDLTALMLGLQSLKKKILVDQEALTQLESLYEITYQLSQQIHDIATELRPTALSDLGLQTALQSFVERWEVRTGIKVDFQIGGLDQQRLSSVVETAVYRIVQEALTNIIKHANAHNVLLTLNRYSDQLIVIIADDGQGFDVEAISAKVELEKRLGLLGMKERITLVGGVLDIESTPGKGTVLALRIPLSLRDKEQT